jgi:PTS system galactitol-specific IIC component
VAIVVNIVMLVTRMTRVVNVDIWNIWHMTFTGAMLHIATGSYWIGILGVVVHAAFVYKLGDWFAKDTRFLRPRGYCDPARQFGVFRPVAVLVDTIIDKIPALTAFTLAPMISRNASVPLVNRSPSASSWGWSLALAGYDLKSILQLAVKTAAVMLLMPRVIKPIMDGLTPIAKQARKRLQAKFGGQEFPDWSRSGAAAWSYLGVCQPDLYPADHSDRRRGSW